MVASVESCPSSSIHRCGSHSCMLAIAIVPALLLLFAAQGYASAPDLGSQDLGSQAQALIIEHCAPCHSAASKSYAGITYRGDLDMLDFDALRRDGWVDLDRPEESEIYVVIRDGDMPQRRAVAAGDSRLLTAVEAATILAWISAGAPDPGVSSGISPGGEAIVPVTPAGSAPSASDLTAVLAEDADSIERGRKAFERWCTQCHDASRALDKTKTLSAWRRTVSRMAAKTSAGIPQADILPIAIYLASLEKADDGDGRTVLDSFLDAMEFHATISLAFRNSAREDVVENNGFFPEVWVGAEWHPEDSPFSARVTACTTCHSSNEPQGNRIELVEAAFRMDIDHVIGMDESSTLDMSIDAGRFIVPFGTSGNQGHPGSLRTVSRPLAFNMGQSVYRDEIGPAVLPGPYADEGLLFNLGTPVTGDLVAGVNAYAVNGLQGGTDVNFFESRDYTDNNGDPAFGGRVSLGLPAITLGSSYMAGRMDDTGSFGFGKKLGYELFGVDVTARYGKRVRLLAEYAKRKNDQLIFAQGTSKGEAKVEGYAVEGDLLLLPDSGVSLIARYDSLLYDGDAPPPQSSLDSDYNVVRYTWGFNFALPYGSTLMLNHEHWSMPSGLDSVDLIGFRWIMAF